MNGPGRSDSPYIIRSGAAAESRLELLARICTATASCTWPQGTPTAGSPAVGAQLAGFLHDLGDTEVEVGVRQPVLRKPADQMIHAATVDAIANPVITQGLATAEEVDGLVRTLTDYARAPDTISTLPRIVQICDRRSFSRENPKRPNLIGVFR